MGTYDATEHLRAVHAENLALRELLTLVAQELERLAVDEDRPAQRDALLCRAQRIRQRLHEG